ncbi:hypothetical protein AVEN_269747-1 [Araneus ventricosus]|uniref:Uncharacterized protein n=1 Tax=Araneus ventricosus TaxID=182803 RepID=A0A4Y2EIW8_ARAVE|nr:hypothetical protein AVEN_269747-1 [Araneus ventricosus]
MQAKLLIYTFLRPVGYNDYDETSIFVFGFHLEEQSFDFKYGRKQETDDEEEENVILTLESEDDDFGSFQQEIEVAEMEEAIYLESSMVDFSTNMFVLIDNVGATGIKAHCSYVCGIQEVDGGEYDLTGLKTTNLS